MPTLTSPRQPVRVKHVMTDGDSAEKVADAQSTDAATLDNDKADPGYQSVPTDDWLKADIQQWLDQAAIDYPSSATKAELLALVEDGG
jgi:hypothetical protein